MKTTLLLILALSFNALYAQTERTENEISQTAQSTTVSENKSQVEKKTTNKGGGKFNEYISKKIVVPTDPNFVGGTVIVEFVVQTDGLLRVEKITNDLGFGISEQLRKIFEECKKWTPGIKDGQPVEVKYSMPINIYGDN